MGYSWDIPGINEGLMRYQWDIPSRSLPATWFAGKSTPFIDAFPS